MRSAAEGWIREVNNMPSLFGKLIYFTTLRDKATGRYCCSDLDCPLPEQDGIIRQAHTEAFYQFLALPLSRITEELLPYLETFRERVPALQELANDLIPPDAGLESVVLFVGTVDIIASLLNRKRRMA